MDPSCLPHFQKPTTDYADDADGPTEFSLPIFAENGEGQGGADGLNWNSEIG